MDALRTNATRLRIPRPITGRRIAPLAWPAVFWRATCSDARRGQRQRGTVMGKEKKEKNCAEGWVGCGGGSEERGKGGGIFVGKVVLRTCKKEADDKDLQTVKQASQSSKASH
jgi:hypothetical protein